MNRIYYLKIEIDEIKEEIESISELSSSKISGMPHGTKRSDPTQEHLLKKQKLIDKLNKKLKKYIDELNRMEEIIDNVEDAQIRVIMRMRFIECKKWHIIERAVHLDRSACYRKIQKYLERETKDETSRI